MTTRLALRLAVSFQMFAACLAAHATDAGMVDIPAGSFLRGSSPDRGLFTNTVYVSEFEMDKNLVTYMEWTNVYQWAVNHGYLFDNAGAGFGNNHPVQTVNWYDVVKWCNARSQFESTPENPISPCYYTDAAHTQLFTSGFASLQTNNVDWNANGYRLPTEAEWEKAARGGSNSLRFPWGNIISHQNAAYASPGVPPSYDAGPPSQGPTTTVPVGNYAPNGYGLCDMAGNVQEWCWDIYSSGSYNAQATNNPWGPSSGLGRVNRGGSWNATAVTCRTPDREQNSASSAYNFIGFRTVRAIGSQTQQAQTPIMASNVISGPIFYGQSLSVASASLSGTMLDNSESPLAGSWAFNTPNAIPTASLPSVLVTFTPNDSSYSPFTTNVTVTVNQTQPTLTLSATPITLGQMLSASSLTASRATNSYNNALVTGTYSFNSDTSVQLPLGPTSESVTFTPDDSTDYTTAGGNVSVQVNLLVLSRTNLSVKTPPVATSIAFGLTLASSGLSGGAFNIASGGVYTGGGQLAFINPGITPFAGATNVQVTFTPTDPNYNSLTTSVPVTVTKAVPQLSLGTTVITYGQTLASSSLASSTALNPNNNASLTSQGNFAFVNSTLVPNAGTTNVNVRFTPVDTKDYVTVTNSTTVTVGKATPGLSLPLPGGITFGQSLASSTLAGGSATNSFNRAVVPGKFAYTTPSTQPVAGSFIAGVTFTPSNSVAGNYNTATANVHVTVAKDTPTLTAPTATEILVGNTLAASTLAGGGAVNSFSALGVSGGFAFTSPSTKPNLGTASQNVTFTPGDAANYNNATTTVSVTVVGAPTNVLSLASVSASPITYGQAVSNSTVTATFTNASGIIKQGSVALNKPDFEPGAGAVSVSFIFTPADLTYKKSTNAVSVTVLPAPLFIQANDSIWDETSDYPVFTVTCTGLLPQDIQPGADTTALVGTNTVFGTNLVVWSPADSNWANLSDNTYSDFIIPVLSGSTNNNYVVTYGYGSLTIVNSFVAPNAKAAAVNGIVSSAALGGFVGTNIVDQSGLNNVLAHYWSQSPPCITNATHGGQGSFAFTITNFNLTVQCSADLVHWTNLNGAASIWFSDTNARPNNCYYRLVGGTNY